MARCSSKCDPPGPRLADEQRRAGRRLRCLDTWIAAAARRHDAVVLTQDSDFTAFVSVEVRRV